MKKLKYFFVITMCVLLYGQSGEAAVFNFVPSNTSSNPVVQPKIQSATNMYPIGENLVYKIIWMGVPIGNGKISLNQNTDDYSAEVVATGNDFLNAFFPVEDVLRSEFSKEGFSQSFHKNVREGKYQADEVIHFDYEKDLARYKSQTNNSEKEYPIAGDLHDVISAFYWVRKQPMAIGGLLKTDVFNDERIWDLTFNVKEVKPVYLSDRSMREAIVLESFATVEGEIVGKGKVKIYVSNDEQRIPLLVKLKTPFGRVVGELTDVYQS